MKTSPPDTTNADVFGKIALRMREIVRQEHVNNLSGAEQFTVKQVSPIQIEQMQGDLVLTDGDPDFTVGAWLRQYLLTYTLHVGDLVWCLREGTVWHAVDLADPGGQSAWSHP